METPRRNPVEDLNPAAARRIRGALGGHAARRQQRYRRQDGGAAAPHDAAPRNWRPTVTLKSEPAVRTRQMVRIPRASRVSAIMCDSARAKVLEAAREVGETDDLGITGEQNEIV